MRPIDGQESPQGVEEHFGVAFPETGRYDVAPCQEVPVISDAACVGRGNGVWWGWSPSPSGEDLVWSEALTRDTA